MKFKLDMRTALPLIRTAFSSKQLQMQKPRNRRAETDVPSYSGPCAIGVCFTPGQRKELDDISLSTGQYLISDLYEENVIDLPQSQLSDFRELQEAHDTVFGSPYKSERMELFKKLLTQLETKYGVAR